MESLSILGEILLIITGHHHSNFWLPLSFSFFPLPLPFLMRSFNSLQCFSKSPSAIKFTQAWLISYSMRFSSFCKPSELYHYNNKLRTHPYRSKIQIAPIPFSFLLCGSTTIMILIAAAQNCNPFLPKFSAPRIRFFLRTFFDCFIPWFLRFEFCPYAILIIGLAKYFRLRTI